MVEVSALLSRVAGGTRAKRHSRVLSSWPGRVFVGVLCLVVLVGGALAHAAAGNERVSFEETEGFVFFGEGVRLTAFFRDLAVRLVFSDGREVVLEQGISASGARYTDGRTLFWNKGDEALLEWDGQTYNTRRATPDNDVWEQARQAGVQFRAVGQEPGWLAEIRSGETLHLLLDYGTTVMTTPLREFYANFATGERTFVAKPPSSPLHVTVYVEEAVCYDAMSGEGFTSTVTLDLPDAGATYRGCGRDL